MMREAYRRFVLLFGDLLIFVYCKRYEVVGREHIPATGGVIVVSNHLNNADPPMIQRALSRRKVSVVFVDPASFNGAARRPEPALLRLQAAGIAVAVVRADDDLAACLSSEPTTESAHA